MDRRSFLRLLGTAGAGAAAGGVGGHLLPRAAAAASSEDSESTLGLERTDAAAPVGPRPALGIQRVIWSVPTDQPLVALTFDDGPDPEFTPKILALLEKHNVRATFNVMGWNALRHPELLKAAVAGGHEIGNHTWSHRDLAYESYANTVRQLQAGKSAIEDLVEAPIRFLRPPRGELTGAAARAAAELGYDILLWSATRGPRGVGTGASVAAFVLGYTEPGDVLGMHDGIGRATFNPHGADARYLRARRHAELDALPAILDGARARGLVFTTASELVKAGTSASADA
jgi:peptidoglycan/xylan/chitin deacetylase (PgdA/CDA1 family)